MTTDKVKQALRAQPFAPFDVNLVDGRSFRVSHPEMMAVGKQQIAIIYGNNDEHEIIDLLLVTSLSLPSKRPAKNGKKH